MNYFVQLSLEKDLAGVRRLYEGRAAELGGLRREVKELRSLQEGEAKRTTEVRRLNFETSPGLIMINSSTEISSANGKRS